MNIIDLNERRNAKDAPDADCIRTDEFGRKLYRYALEYKTDDGTWGLDLWAYSMEDAQNRVDAIRQSLVLLGQTHAIIQA